MFGNRCVTWVLVLCKRLPADDSELQAPGLCLFFANIFSDLYYLAVYGKIVSDWWMKVEAYLSE